MSLASWDERYRAQPQLWGRDPNATVAAELGSLPRGRALDVGAGDGRHALWLAELGWQVVAVDGSRVAIDQLRAAAVRRGVEVVADVADVTTDELPHGPFDLVLLAYLQLPRAELGEVHRRAAAAVGPGGTLLVLGHDRSNLADGVGGPQDPDVLLTVDEVVGDLVGTGLTIERAEVVTRTVATEEGERHALDTLVRAHR